MHPTSGESKLAIYYAPLSTALNQEQLEEAPFEAKDNGHASEDQIMESAPLFGD